ncbi:MAG: GGDEF domain-containing protein [Anaerolineales bacterium]|nr:GGDEF domain-containing protein [Anaerolineales bacterium]
MLLQTPVRSKGKQYFASILAIFAFLFSGQPLNGKTAQPEQKTSGPVTPYPAPGSVVRFEHLGIENGLSQNTGQVIFQDSRGFLWIGTQDGLNRYDGYAFTVFRHDPDNLASISNNSILSITEDVQGFLWVGTRDGGLNRFDPVTEKFISYHNNPRNSNSLSNNTVTSILRDSHGTLWVGTLDGLNRFNPKSNGFDRFMHQPNDPTSLSSNVISTLFEDSLHQLWVGTGALGQPGAGLNRFNPSTGRSVRFQHSDSNPTSLASDNISDIYEAPDGNFWIGTGGYQLTGGGVELFNPQTGTFFHYQYDAELDESVSGNNISALWGDSNGILWISTWANGLNSMDLSNAGHFTRYQHDPYFADSLSGDDIWSLFKDRSGILWIGTIRNGVNKLPAKSGQFNLYHNNPRDPNSLGMNTVGAFSEDQYGNVWVGTWGSGLDRFDPRHGRFEHFRQNLDDINSLSSNLVMSVYVSSENIVWVGTRGGGLNRMELATGKITHYLHDLRNPNSLPDDNVAAIVPDGSGGVWLGTFGGLSHYNPDKDVFINYSSDISKHPSNPAGLSENKVISLYLDGRKNVLWVGTWGGGLGRLNLADPLQMLPLLASFKTYRYSADNPNSISDDSVWSIHGNTDGTLWLGTQSGLNHFDPSTQTFERYTKEQGLPSETVLGVLKDDQGVLWLPTNNGLVQFNPQTKEFTTFDKSDGLQDNQFNTNAYFQSRDGVMYVGGVDGFNTFRPENIQPNPTPPQVAITDFQVLNKPWSTDLSGRTPIRLSYQEDFISFGFAALDFQSPQSNQYAYMLEGFDKDWTQAGSRRYAAYTSLPGGGYTFRVKASNSDGVWSEPGIAIPVIVAPPVWELRWFQGVVVALLVLFIALGFRWRLNTIHLQKTALERQVAIRTSELLYQIEQRQKAEQALAEKAAQEAVAMDRTRLARDLHDAVTQTLFSASMIAEVLPDIWSTSQAEGQRRLGELRQLTRGALAEMRTLLVELRPSGLTEIPLPELLRQLCESLVGRARLPIQLHTEGIQKLPPELQVCLYRITQEALNNVIKHARATQVLVNLILEEDKISLSVIDNGNGFVVDSVSPEHYGLKIMRERAETVGAVFTIYSEPGAGTQVVVSWIPPDFDMPAPPLTIQSSPEPESEGNETQTVKENG